MKKHLHNSLRALFLSLAVLLSMPMMAVEIDGINYDFNAEAKEATVIAKSGDKYSGEVVIPEYVEHDGTAYSVTSIGDYAFHWCSGLTSVTIPNSVTSIGKSAFRACSGLTSVTIPNSVTSIGNNAFDDCSSLGKVLNFSNLYITKGSTGYGYVGYYAYVVLNNPEIIDNYVFAPNGNTYALYGYMGTDSNLQLPEKYKGENYVIGDYAFAACSGLTSVTIPNSVESIGDYAFYNCYRLTSVTIPNSVTSIGDYAFYNCLDLTSVTIPNSVTSIGDEAFSYCSGLTSVTIPNSVTSIGKWAFSGCSGLTSVTIGNSVTWIGDEAFWGCRLQTIVCKAIKPESGSGITSTNMYNHTQLYVPECAYWDYAFSDWGKFIRIKEMAMDAEDLESRKVYMIADATGRNYSVYDSEKGDLVNVVYTHSLDEESEGSCWVVLKEGDTSYLYNIGAKKYGAIAEDGALTLSDAPVGVDIVSTGEGLSINGKPCMFVLNNNISFDATGIGELKGENGTEKSVVYDLSGRRVQKAQKGVFIQNGKVVVK